MKHHKYQKLILEWKLKRNLIKSFITVLIKKYDKKNKWFKIKYVDGDAEDLDLDELKKVLVKPTTEIRKKN